MDELEEKAELLERVEQSAPDKKDADQDPEEEEKVGNPDKKTQTRESHHEAFWYKLCERYKQYQEENPTKNCSQRAFLKSKEALEVTGAPRECRSFSRYWKRFEKGELNPTSNRRRRRSVGYVEIEERLSTYLRLRSMIFVRGDVNGATWAKLKQKCVKWGARELKELQSREEQVQEAEGENGLEATSGTESQDKDTDHSAIDSKDEKSEKKYSDFRASPGWLHKVLKRNNIEVSYSANDNNFIMQYPYHQSYNRH